MIEEAKRRGALLRSAVGEESRRPGRTGAMVVGGAYGALICLLCSGAWAGISVTLHSAATVRQAQITVGDVASVTGPEGQLSTARAVVLGPSPVLGTTRTLRRDQIAWRLAQCQVSGATVSGPTTISVTRITRAVSAAEMDRTAQDCLRQAMGEEGGELSLTLLAPMKEAVVPDGDVQVTGTPTGATVVALRSVLLTITCEDRVVHTQTARYRVQRQSDVAVAARRLAAGDALTTTDWSVQRTDVAGLAARPLAPGEMEGRRLRRAVSPGAVLTVDNTELMPLVLKGHMVTVSVRVGAVTLNCDGIAQMDGVVGDTIKVLNAGAKEVFTATVSGPGRVEIGY